MISVIMGVYNCEKRKEMLLKSVQSIIRQSYSEWEFIICDDGSTDGTLKILHNIASLDKRIKVLTYNENKGLSYALNECLKYAKGEYIARQDDDDISKTIRLEEELNFLKKNNEYDFVGTLAEIYDQDGVYAKYNVEEQPMKRHFLWNSPFIHPTVLFRKKALDEIGGYRVARETERCEDYDLFMRLYSNGKIGYNIQTELYEYFSDRKIDKVYRPFKIRLNEAKVRLMGFYRLRLYIIGIPFIMKPIILGILPSKLMILIQKYR